MLDLVVGTQGAKIYSDGQTLLDRCIKVETGMYLCQKKKLSQVGGQIGPDQLKLKKFGPNISSFGKKSFISMAGKTIPSGPNINLSCDIQ